MAYYGWSSGTELYHYGIPGQKWGQRRYQNPDGSLTEEGRARYGRIANRHYAAGRALSGYAKRHSGTRLGNLAAKAAKRQVAIGNSYRSSKTQTARDKKIQKALKIGAGVAGAGLAAGLAYRAIKDRKDLKKLNASIESGKRVTDNLSNIGKMRTSGNARNLTGGSDSIQRFYVGNDGRIHGASLKIGRNEYTGKADRFNVYNRQSGKQSTIGSLKEYRRSGAKKNYKQTMKALRKNGVVNTSMIYGGDAPNWSGNTSKRRRRK